MKVLLLVYDFPPNNTVAALRVNSWLKYAKNIEYTVITRKWSDNIKSVDSYATEDQGDLKIITEGEHKIHYVPYSQSLINKLQAFCTKNNLLILRKGITLLSYILMWNKYLNYELGFLYQYAKQHLNESTDKYSAILTSGEPFILFKYASLLSGQFHLPWIADYRDSWTSDPSLLHKFPHKHLLGLLKVYEAKILKSCHKITAAATDIIKDIPSQNTYLLENGVDLELINTVISKPIEEFSLLFVGSIYEQHDVQSLLEASIKFQNNFPKEKNFKVKFVGINYRPNQNTEYINHLANQYPFIEILERQKQAKAIELQKESYILFKFTIKKPINGFYGAKLYEYVATGRPILNIVNRPSDKETDFFPSNQTLVCGTDEIYSFLVERYQTYQTGKKDFCFNTKEELYSISREKQSDQLEKLLLSVSS